MISYIEGKIKNINEKYITLLTDAGVGYKIFATLNTLLSKNENENLELLIHTVVKDDAIDLYGFENKDELNVFEKLITVSGVGPRSALNMLSISNIQNIAFAIENGDVAMLSGIPGIGKKTCEKIIIELKGKMSAFVKNSAVNNKLQEESDARLALSSLGYNEKDTNNAINNLKNELNEEFIKLNASEIIKKSLKFLR